MIFFAIACLSARVVGLHTDFVTEIVTTTTTTCLSQTTAELPMTANPPYPYETAASMSKAWPLFPVTGTNAESSALTRSNPTESRYYTLESGRKLNSGGSIATPAATTSMNTPVFVGEAARSLPPRGRMATVTLIMAICGWLYSIYLFLVLRY
ncbi:hypothetical protein IF2G_10832 [Cordyceps javanica]|nr:hypothetical protein IF2G_10832 [Cordyceps javanica]